MVRSCRVAVRVSQAECGAGAAWRCHYGGALGRVSERCTAGGAPCSPKMVGAKMWPATCNFEAGEAGLVRREAERRHGQPQALVDVVARTHRRQRTLRGGAQRYQQALHGQLARVAVRRAAAVERHDLHERYSVNTRQAVGTPPRPPRALSSSTPALQTGQVLKEALRASQLRVGRRDVRSVSTTTGHFLTRPPAEGSHSQPQRCEPDSRRRTGRGRASNRGGRTALSQGRWPAPGRRCTQTRSPPAPASTPPPRRPPEPPLPAVVGPPRLPSVHAVCGHRGRPLETRCSHCTAGQTTPSLRSG